MENHLRRHIGLNEHLDIFALVKSGLDRVGKSFKGHGLDALANATIGRGKTGSGSRAPELARIGRWAELTNYCLEDVLLTRDLGHFIAKEGYIIDRDAEQLTLHVPDWFRQAPSPITYSVAAPSGGQTVEKEAPSPSEAPGASQLST
jgi:hypothetical protein